ncbi:MAG: NAD(+) synthase [Candidatus Shapirobacteria bacterium]|nr:NAD(+) synthase [Candidatus Shapirobacteria bacterium]
MTLILEKPEKEVNKIENFIKTIFVKTGFKKAIVAVSGGIDSALSCTLLCQALGFENVIPVLLPYGSQSSIDGKLLCKWNKIPEDNWQEINIKKIVDQIKESQNIGDDKLRLGNVMARTRMIILYDLAKKYNCLVCGTENKSEKYLGYFTRFGDAASDLEPIEHLYKTQVQQLARFLNLSENILNKRPSAELWDGQTDETEFGFTYDEADRVMENELEGVPGETVKKILKRIESQKFKQLVPYKLINN